MISRSDVLVGTLARAADYAANQGHAAITLEHLLLALTEDDDAAGVLAASQVDLARLRNEVAAFIGQQPPAAAVRTSPMPDADLTKILTYAEAAARQSGRSEINGAIVLAAIVGEGRSMAATLLKAQGLTFQAAIKVIQQVLAPEPQPVASGPQADHGQEVEQPEAAPVASPGHRTPATEGAAATTAGDEAGAIASNRRTEPITRVPIPEVQRPQREVLGIPSIRRDPPPRPPAPPRPQPAPKAPEPRDEAEEPVKEEEAKSAPSARAQTPPGAPATAEPPSDVASQPPPPAALTEGHRPAPSIGDRMPAPQPAPPAGEWRPPTPSRPPAGTPSQEPPPYPSGGRPPPLPARPPDVAQPATPLPSDSADLPARSPAAPHPPGRVGGSRPPPRPGGRQPPNPLEGHQITAPWPEPTTDYRPAGPAGHPQSRGPGARPVHREAGQNVPRPGRPPPPPPSGRPSVEKGQLVENIPRRMKVGVVETFEVRIAREGVMEAGQGFPGRAEPQFHAIRITRAMSVRIKGEPGRFYIECASPETQWTGSHNDHLASDYAIWRFTIIPQQRGPAALTLIVSARSIGTDGVIADTNLPEQRIAIRVSANMSRGLKKWAVWTGVAVFGGILAKVGESVWEPALILLRRMLSL